MKTEVTTIVASVFIFVPISIPSPWEGQGGFRLRFRLRFYYHFLNFFPITGSELSGMSFITTMTRYASMSTVLVSI